MSVISVSLRDSSLDLPAYATEGSACFDIRAYFREAEIIQAYNKSNTPKELVVDASDSLLIPPDHRVAVPTGQSWAIPSAFCVLLHPRSGLSFSRGLVLINQTGVIDSDYRDEVKVLLHNVSSKNQIILSGDRIAQGEFRTVLTPSFYTTERLNKTKRKGGLGSTGVK
jgi:dUTP pyrophosphatase